MSFLPDDIGIDDYPTIFARRDGFRIDDDHLPLVRGRIVYDRPAEQRWRAYRDGRFESCDRSTPGARLYLRIETEVDDLGVQTIDVPPASHRSLKEFVDHHRDERVMLTVEPAGKHFTIRFAPDDGPRAKPVF